MDGQGDSLHKSRHKRALISIIVICMVLLTAGIILSATGTLHQMFYPNAIDSVYLEKLFSSDTASAQPVPNTPTDSAERLYQAGVIDRQAREKADTSNRAVFNKGKNITIYKDEVDAIVAKDALTNTPNSKNQAIIYLLKREALYHEALALGNTVTDREIADAVENNKANIQKADNYTDFQEYLKGAGQTLDEYCTSQAETVKKDLVIDKYVLNLMKGYSTITIQSKQITLPDKPWNEKLNLLTLEILKQENLQIYE